MGVTRPAPRTPSTGGSPDESTAPAGAANFASPSVLLARAPAPPVLQSASVDVDLVRSTAARLFERVDPTSVAGAEMLSKRDLPHVYPKSILEAVDKRFAAAVQNRECIYVRGAQRRVGVTSFLCDYARSYNYYAARVGDPRRIAYVKLPRGLSSGTKFLDEVGAGVRASLSISELRFRGTGTIAGRIIDTLRLYRVSVLILDHIQLLPASARTLISDLADKANPVHAVPLELGEYAELQPRIGIVVAGDKDPADIFTKPEETLPYLLATEIVYPSYQTAEDVADALRRSDIGLEDLDAARFDDALLAQYVLELTNGQIHLISRLLQVVDWLARVNRVTRPTLDLFTAAAPFDRELKDRIFERGNSAPARKTWEELERRAHAYMSGEPVPLPTRDPHRSESEARRPPRGTSPSPKEVHDGREHAERLRQQMTTPRRTRKRNR